MSIIRYSLGKFCEGKELPERAALFLNFFDTILKEFRLDDKKLNIMKKLYTIVMILLLCGQIQAQIDSLQGIPATVPYTCDFNNQTENARWILTRSGSVYSSYLNHFAFVVYQQRHDECRSIRGELRIKPLLCRANH